MGIVPRPTKASSGNKNYQTGTKIFSNEANDDANTLYDEFNGRITAANVDPAAGFTGDQIADGAVTTNKLANISVTTVKVVDKNITGPKIANDPTVDASRAINTDHIKNNAVIARIIKVLTVDWTPGGNIGAGAELHNSTGLDRTTALIPLTFEVIATVDPPAGTGNIAQLCLKMWRNTNSNIYFMSVSNPSASVISLTGLTFRLTYIPIS